MLSNIWVSGSGAIKSDGRFWIYGTVAQRCCQEFSDDARAINATGSFFRGLSAALTDPKGRRANVEGNG
jgi:fluoride ion exporter CrcB/FEX